MSNIKGDLEAYCRWWQKQSGVDYAALAKFERHGHKYARVGAQLMHMQASARARELLSALVNPVKWGTTTMYKIPMKINYDVMEARR